MPLDSYPLKEKAHYTYSGVILYFKGVHLKESKGHKKMEPEENTQGHSNLFAAEQRD